jgi:hypothetical protein
MVLRQLRKSIKTIFMLNSMSYTCFRYVFAHPLRYIAVNTHEVAPFQSSTILSYASRLSKVLPTLAHAYSVCNTRLACISIFLFTVILVCLV